MNTVELIYYTRVLYVLALTYFPPVIGKPDMFNFAILLFAYLRCRWLLVRWTLSVRWRCVHTYNVSPLNAVIAIGRTLLRKINSSISYSLKSDIHYVQEISKTLKSKGYGKEFFF